MEADVTALIRFQLTKHLKTSSNKDKHMLIVYGVIAMYVGYQMIEGNLFVFGTYLGTPGWILAIAGVWMIWKWVNRTKSNTSANDQWDELVAAFEYKHFYKGTGVAVDTRARVVHLYAEQILKTYAFSDIREWSYKLLTGGTVIGGTTLAAGVHNTMQMRENKANSGFFHQC